MRAAFSALAMVLALGVAAPAAALAQDPDLAGEWHLDSIAGGATPDSSGHDLAGTVTGTTTAVADGRFNQAVRFPVRRS